MKMEQYLYSGVGSRATNRKGMMSTIVWISTEYGNR